MADMFTPDRISAGNVALDLLPYGCTAYALHVSNPAKTVTRDLLIGPANPASLHYLHGRRFLNQIVGRYANRLPAGKVEFAGGAELDLEGDNGVCLHGGQQGFDTAEWTSVSLKGSRLFTSADLDGSTDLGDSARIYRWRSEDGADGFPGALETEVLSKILASRNQDQAGTLKLAIRAKLDESTPAASCPINLTWHTGFNLGSFDEEHVKSHKLFINAEQTPQLSSNMLATGTLSNIEPRSELDFFSSTLDGPHRLIGDGFPDGGVDHNFVFKAIDTSKPQVVLSSPDGKVSLAFRTNQSTVQCYTAGGFDTKGPARKKLHDPNSIGPYGRFGAVFLEFHHPLATFLHPTFQAKAGTDTILRQGETYENWVEIDIKVSD